MFILKVEFKYVIIKFHLNMFVFKVKFSILNMFIIKFHFKNDNFLIPI